MDSIRSLNILNFMAFALLLLAIVFALLWLVSFISFDSKFVWACAVVSITNIVAISLLKYWKPSIVEEIGIGLFIVVALLSSGLYDWAFFAFFCVYCWFIIRLINWQMGLMEQYHVSTIIPMTLILLISGGLGYWATVKIIGI